MHLNENNQLIGEIEKMPAGTAASIMKSILYMPPLGEEAKKAKKNELIKKLIPDKYTNLFELKKVYATTQQDTKGVESSKKPI